MTDSQTATGGPAAAGTVGRLWKRLKARLRPAPIATADALRTFLAERAALIAQKCAIDYCRGKTGLASYALFTEKPFLDALDRCRWDSFAAVLGDLMIVAEGKLRPHVGTGEHSRLCAGLAGLYPEILATLPPPAHRADGWTEAQASFTSRFREASLGPPRQALDVADHSARRLFDTLPIHTSYRELDEEVVYGAVRFRMIAVSQELSGRLRATELVKELLAQSPSQNVTL
ncbi:MAG TPA: hypothetical protein VLB72_16230 [Burkholderiales bacterium]|nr:hypothetical protein [Burkholderiales bacterium]